MNKRLKTEWVKALRSGSFEQTTSYLESGGRYCCLGVLCRVAEKTYGFSPRVNYDEELIGETLGEQRDDFGLGKFEESGLGLQNKLVDMNDNGKDFPSIAEWIETNIPEDA